MQSDRPKAFSRASTAVVWVVTLGALVWIVMQIAKSTPNPLNPLPAAPTTPPVTLQVASSTPALSYTSSIRAPGGTIRAALATTAAAREQGLSDIAALPKDSGLLFVFPNAGEYGFWMKDMHFPIDMVWIGADRKVSGVVPGVSPATYPTIFYPPAPISYVLELASGEAAKMHIAPGVELVF